MEGLLRAVPRDGSLAEDALRVIAFFDRLVEHRAQLSELVRSTARLVEGAAGFQGRSLGPPRSVAADRFGKLLSDGIPRDAMVRRVSPDGGRAHEEGSDDEACWVLPSHEFPLGELVLERMTLAAESIIAREGARLGSPAGAPLQRLFDPLTPVVDRAHCVQSLGFGSDSSVRAVLRTGASVSELTQEWREWSKESGRLCVTASLDEGLVAALVPGSAVVPSSSRGGLTGVGSAVSGVEAAQSLTTARWALRFTSDDLGPTFVRYDDLGGLQALVAIEPWRAAENHQVRSLKDIARTSAGSAELRALDAYCRHDNLRAAAQELQLHHSSLANRLRNVERKLGIDLSRPEDRFAIRVSLQLYRLAASAGFGSGSR